MSLVVVIAPAGPGSTMSVLPFLLVLEFEESMFIRKSVEWSAAQINHSAELAEYCAVSDGFAMVTHDACWIGSGC